MGYFLAAMVVLRPSSLSSLRLETGILIYVYLPQTGLLNYGSRDYIRLHHPMFTSVLSAISLRFHFLFPH